MFKLSEHTRYFIGAQAPGDSWSHITLKYLGIISDDEVEQWKTRLDNAENSVTKFKLESLGIGRVGYNHPAGLADYIRPTPRVRKAFKFVNNLSKDTLPHVTRQYFRSGKETVPFQPLDDSLVEEIHLYKIEGHKQFTPIHTVKLRRRTPVEFLKDLF